MKIKKTDIAILIIILISFATAAYYYPQMPGKMASHWNARGEADDYISKGFVLYLIPVITAVMYMISLLILEIDPLRKNIEKFRKYFDWFILFMIVFLFYIHILAIATNLGYVFNMATMILPPMGVLFICTGFLTERAKRNWSIGIRTPWTLSDDAVWEKTNKLGGKLFKAAGIITILGVFSGSASIWIALASVLTAAILPMLYSCVEYKKSKKKE
jgi:uncharacterized membrane protein